MARKPAVQITCDRTGEATIVQLGVTLENMNKPRLEDEPALELTFRRLSGEKITVVFDDLCERADAQVKMLVDAIKDDGYFMLVPLAGDGRAADAKVDTGVAASAEDGESEADEPKRGSRRTYVEIESDELDAAVEAASSMVDKIASDPDAAELDVADARETLRDALRLRAYFAALSEKEQKKYTSNARSKRKAGGQPARPANLPPLAAAELKRYGLLDVAEDDDHGDHPDATTGPDVASDDADIFALATQGADDPEQTDFL